MRVPVRVPLLAWVCLTLLGVGLQACQEEIVPAPTQVTLHIESQDSALLSRLTELRVSVALQQGAGWKRRTGVSVPRANLVWPVDIPVTPRSSADDDAQFEVLVEALEGELVLAATRAITSFARNKHKQLSLALFVCPGQQPGFTCAASECVGITCEVCSAQGMCVPVGVSSGEDLPPVDITPLDAGSTDVNGAVPPANAGLDGGTDATSTVDAALPGADARTAVDGGTVLPGPDAQAPSGLDAGPRDAAADARAEAGGNSLEAGPSDASIPVDSTTPADASVPVDSSASVDAGGGNDRFANARQVCVDTINMYRAMRGLSPLKRAATSVETCSDNGAKKDGDSGNAHGSANSCPGMSSQNTCPGWPVGGFGGGATLEAALQKCLAQMWAEGEPPEGTQECLNKYFKGDTACFLAHGHYINMKNAMYSAVSCGFYEMSANKFWMNQDFGR